MARSSLNDEYTVLILDQVIEHVRSQSQHDASSLPYALVEFVQEFHYQLDNDTGLVEYPKHPVETLFDQNGDCEDTSILLGALLSRAGIYSALVYIPGHIGLGVACPDSMANAKGFYEFSGRKLCYVETTSKFDVGEWPAGKDFSNAKLFEI